MDWWTISKPYVEAPMAVVAFALAVGNTGWLIYQARKVNAEDKKRKGAERELKAIVSSFISKPGLHLIVGHEVEGHVHMDALALGLSRGVLRGFYADGKLHVILATVDNDAAEHNLKWAAKEHQGMAEHTLVFVMQLVAQHGGEFVEVPPGLIPGAPLTASSSGSRSRRTIEPS
jgi:hypothetical protein